MGNGPYKGSADYLELGTYNAVCSMCGRKRKANYLERNWMGLYRCPEHNEPRQPQDFVRNVPDIMTVPWGQPQEVQYVPNGGVTFPLSAVPDEVQLVGVAGYLETEDGLIITTESGESIELESGTVPGLATEGGEELETESGEIVTAETNLYLSPLVRLIVPLWITVTGVQWTWLSGGAGIGLSSPYGLQTYFVSASPTSSGIAQAAVTSSLGSIAYTTVGVNQ